MLTFRFAMAVFFAALAAVATAQNAPRQLDELIPDSAKDDPEGWAARGVTTLTEPPVASQTDSESGEIANAEAIPASTAQVAAPIEVPIPEPLEPDSDPDALASIDSPSLNALPDLVERRISDRLVLAFPSERTLFPLQDEFISRFRALSNIEALASKDATIPQLAARARADEGLLEEALRVYGYYDADVIRQLSGGRREQPRVGSDVDIDPRVRFDIIPGRQYRFGEIDLGAFALLGDAALREEAFRINRGDPLLADRIISERSNVDRVLGESGYPFVIIQDPSLLIDHADYTGDLTMEVEPGGRYNFGEVISDMPEFLSGRHLGRIARFEAGETYRRSLQEDLRDAVLATGLVSRVRVEPRIVTPAQGDDPGEVAMDVSITPAPLRTIAGAIGYGTEEGARIEASWEHRNLFPPEGALRLRGVLGTREALGSISYKRNNFLGRDQILIVEAFASDIDTQAVDARTVGLRGTFEKVSNLLFQKPLTWAGGAEVLYTDERNRVIGGIASPRQVYTIGGVFGSITWDGSDDLLDPTTGSRVTLFLAPEVSSSLSDEAFYFRAQADASFYRPVASTVLAGRVRFATIQGAEPFQIAPSRRLYSGGGGSVRGYGFQAIGPRNDFGEPTGGGSLVEVGIEARIPTGLLDNAIDVVPFFDAGSVSLSSTPDFRAIQYGAGIGIRYDTSFGPIRVDVGAPLNPGEFDSPIFVYVSLGQAF